MIEVVVPRAIPRDHRSREQRMEETRARWKAWQQALDEGEYGNRAELARAVGVSRAAVTKGLMKLHGSC